VVHGYAGINKCRREEPISGLRTKRIEPRAARCLASNPSVVREVSKRRQKQVRNRRTFVTLRRPVSFRDSSKCPVSNANNRIRSHDHPRSAAKNLSPGQGSRQPLSGRVEEPAYQPDPSIPGCEKPMAPTVPRDVAWNLRRRLLLATKREQVTCIRTLVVRRMILSEQVCA
jgi:hypothetical protein